jgi:hypothetical protein
MRFAHLVLGLVVTAAAIHYFGPAPPDSGPRLSARQSPPASIVAGSPATAGLQDAAVKIPFLEVQRAPVPLLMKTRPPVVVLDSDSDTDPVSAPRPAGNSTRSAAKASIEADGYKGVRMLSKGLSGGWHATALRGTMEISITVDAQGNVSAD